MTLLQADLWLNLVIALFLLANPPSSQPPIPAATAGQGDSKSAMKAVVQLNLVAPGWIQCNGSGRIAVTNLAMVEALKGNTNCIIHHSKEIRSGALTDLLEALRRTYPHLTTQLDPEP